MSNIRAIEVDQFLPHPPAKVWNALTDPSILAKWWAPGDIAPVVGHEFLLDMGQWGNASCKVLDVEPEQRLVHTFNDWTLTWRLVAEGTGTRLILTHDGFDLEDPSHRFAFDTMGPGWRDDVLPRISSVLEEAAA